MSVFEVVILGLIEGITEFLPISSTAHLILTTHLLNVPQTDFVKSFNIAVQLGAVFSVIWLYWRDLFVNREVAKRVVAAFVPSAALGFVLYKSIKGFLFDNNAVIAAALVIGGAGLIVFELAFKDRKLALEDLATIPYSKCFLLGLCQSMAMIPGVSRSGATIIGGLLLGFGRKPVVEFSFLLAVPTMLAATSLDMIKSGGSFTPDQFGLLVIGSIVAFAVALLSIKFLLGYVQKNSFIPFGVYRVAIGSVLLAALVLR